jgi:hypothetical protein
MNSTSYQSQHDITLDLSEVNEIVITEDINGQKAKIDPIKIKFQKSKESITTIPRTRK